MKPLVYSSRKAEEQGTRWDSLKSIIQIQDHTALLIYGRESLVFEVTADLHNIISSEVNSKHVKF